MTDNNTLIPIPVRKRGRPKKNVELDFNNLNESINVNSKNIYPPNKIVLKKLATIINKVNKDGTVTNKREYNVKLECDKPKIFEILLDGYKGKQQDINMIFTPSGLLFNQSADQKDMIKFECKIFPDNLVVYETEETNVVINVEINTLYKILKTIPKESSFAFYIYVTKINKIFRIVNVDTSRQRYTDRRISVNSVISVAPINFNNTSPYETIVILESEEFSKICKDMSLFTDNFTISCVLSKVGNVKICKLIFEFNKDNLTSYVISNPCNKTVFIKKPDIDIKNTYNLNSFIKYTKSARHSTIVKLYISKNKPLIIEYSVEPGLGTTQLFVEPQNIIS